MIAGDGSCFTVKNNYTTGSEYVGSDCDPLYAVAHDGQFAYTACRDGTVRKYNLQWYASHGLISSRHATARAYAVANANILVFFLPRLLHLGRECPTWRASQKTAQHDSPKCQILRISSDLVRDPVLDPDFAETDRSMIWILDPAHEIRMPESKYGY